MLRAIARFLALSSKPCRVQAASLSRSLDGDTDGAARAAARVHAALCPKCRAFRRDALRLRGAARAGAPDGDAMPDDARARVVEAITRDAPPGP